MIHPSAYVDNSSEMASDVEIGPMAYIGPGCVLHEGVKIGAKATVECYTEIGAGTILSPNAHVGGAPQDLGYRGENTRLVIGKRNIIREFASIHRGTTKEEWVTVVGDDNYFMAGAHIAHDCVIGNRVILAGYAALSGHTHIDDYAVVSGLVGVHQFVHIGKMAMVSALSRLGKDVPPYCTVLNDSIMGLNVVGMRRRGVSPQARAELKKALKIWGNRGLLMEEAKEQLGTLIQYPEITEFRNFIENSKRGIIRKVGSEG